MFFFAFTSATYLMETIGEYWRVGVDFGKNFHYAIWTEGEVKLERIRHSSSFQVIQSRITSYSFGIQTALPLTYQSSIPHKTKALDTHSLLNGYT